MKRWQRWAIGILVGMLLVGGMMFFVLHHSAVPTSSANGRPPSAQSTPNLEQIERSLDVAWIQTYKSAIQQEVAQGCHMSVSQLQTQLHAGKTMTQVAEAQGLTPVQVQTLELTALRDSGQKAVQAGAVPQARLDQFLQVAQSDPAYLEQLITGIFIKNASE